MRAPEGRWCCGSRTASWTSIASCSGGTARRCGSSRRPSTSSRTWSQRRGTIVRKEELLDDDLGRPLRQRVGAHHAHQGGAPGRRRRRQPPGDHPHRPRQGLRVRRRRRDRRCPTVDRVGARPPIAAGLGIAMQPLIGRDAQRADLVDGAGRPPPRHARRSGRRRQDVARARARPLGGRRTTRTVCTWSSS